MFKLFRKKPIKDAESQVIEVDKCIVIDGETCYVCGDLIRVRMRDGTIYDGRLDDMRSEKDGYSSSYISLDTSDKYHTKHVFPDIDDVEYIELLEE